MSSAAALTIVITGGAGFLGRAMVREIRRSADAAWRGATIRIFDMKAAPKDFENVTSIQGDIRDAGALASVFSGADVVFHCASLVDWGQNLPTLVTSVNLGGTQAVLKVAAEAGVRAVVYTSTMDVIYQGQPVRNSDETHPYPSVFKDAYSGSKAAAEKAIIAADRSPAKNATGGLRTCAVRPCGMYGERDPIQVGTILRAAKEGKLLFRMGDGRSLYQTVYVGNVAHAHVVAAQSLLSPAAVAGGQIYLVTDHPPKNFFDFMAPIVQGVGYSMPPKGRSLPIGVMMALAVVVEGLAWLLRPVFRMAPVLTRTSVSIVCQDFSFNGDKIRRDLGYVPPYGEAEAVAMTIEDFKKNGLV